MILALLSLVAVFDNRSPLKSLRPSQPEYIKKSSGAKGDKNFETDQRIWEDPFKTPGFMNKGLREESLFRTPSAQLTKRVILRKE
jgi:hypothetical protein